jgi:hypothetical protein
MTHTQLQKENQQQSIGCKIREPTHQCFLEQFVIVVWSKEDLSSSADCPSALLVADSVVTMHAGRTKFHKHMDGTTTTHQISPATQTNVRSMLLLLVTISVSFAVSDKTAVASTAEWC